MTNSPDPRLLFSAERTLLAWQRSSLALMGFGFVIERFSLFLSALRREPAGPTHHLFSVLVGVLLILVGAGAALASNVAYRRFVRALPSQARPPGYWTGLGSVINVIIGVVGLVLAGYLLMGAL